MTFSGYRVPPGIMFLTSNMPSMTITNKSIRFNKACHKKLDDCERIEMFYHPILQTVVIREADSPGRDGFRWVNESGNNISTISTRIFSRIVYGSMGFNEDCSFRFRGITKIRENMKLLIFSLDEHLVISKKGGKTDEHEAFKQDDKSPRSVADTAGENGDMPAFAYIKGRRQDDNARLYFRKRRNEIIAGITKDDICCRGTVIENPMIGSVPSREKILQELDDLLMTM